MMNSKYLIIPILVFFIGAGVYTAVHRPPVVLNNEVQNQGVAVIPTNTTETTATSKVLEVSATPAPKNQKKPIPTTVDGIQVSVSHAQFPPEVDSVAGLISISENVFVGKVVGRAQKTISKYQPATFFEVDVIEDIKGASSGRITLLQGGVGYLNNKFFVGEGDIGNIPGDKINPDDIFLRIGGVYLFAAEYDKKEDMYGISAAPYDRTLITANPGLSKAQIMTAAHANARVQQFFDLANK